MKTASPRVRGRHYGEDAGDYSQEAAFTWASLKS